MNSLVSSWREGQPGNVFLVESESSPRWPCLWKGKDSAGLALVSCKDPVGAEGAGADRFEVCLNAPSGFQVAGPRRSRFSSSCLCAGRRRGAVGPICRSHPSFLALPPAPAWLCLAFQTAPFPSDKCSKEQQQLRCVSSVNWAAFMIEALLCARTEI